MKQSQILGQIKKELAKARTALVMCHVDPDADTVGSMVAMMLILKGLGKRVKMLSLDPLPHTYDFLPHVREIKCHISANERFDVAITVDAGDVGRLGGLLLKNHSKLVINIDHHPDNTMYGGINLVEKVSSTAELIYDLCKYLKVPITKDIATCLYTAIITDTGNFRYENTAVSTFNIAADLVKSGASPSIIASAIYENNPVSSLRLLALSLNRIRTAFGGKVVWSVVTLSMIKSANAAGEDITGIVDHIRSVMGASVAILFREEPAGLIKINLRSRNKVNVGKIANSLGGGGHARASGVVMRGPLNSVIKKVLNAVSKHVA